LLCFLCSVALRVGRGKRRKGEDRAGPVKGLTSRVQPTMCKMYLPFKKKKNKGFSGANEDVEEKKPLAGIGHKLFFSSQERWIWQLEKGNKILCRGEKDFKPQALAEKGCIFSITEKGKDFSRVGGTTSPKKETHVLVEILKRANNSPELRLRDDVRTV